MNLKILGLNDYESKTYESLVKLGTATAPQISAYSGVPYGRIYDVLESLTHKKLVNLIPENVKKYSASNPENLKKILDAKKKEIESLNKELKNLKQIYEESPEQKVVSGTGIKAFLKLVREQPIAEEFDHSIKWTSEYRPEWTLTVKNEIKKKIDYKVLARYDEETKPSIKKWMKITKNFRKIENEGIAISINEKSVLIGVIPANQTILIKDKSFAKLMNDLFEAKYELAERIKN